MSSINERRRENYRQYLIAYCSELIESQANNQSIIPDNPEEVRLLSLLHSISTEAGERLEREAA